MTRAIQQAVALAWSETDAFVKKRLVLTLFLVLGTAVFAAIAPIALKFAIDSLESDRLTSIDLTSLPDWASSAQTPIVVGPIALILFYIFSLWISRSFGEIRWYFYGTADQRLHRGLSRRLFSHVINLPMSFHLDRKTGALSQTLVQGLAGYRVLLNHAVFTVLPVLIEVLMIGAVLALFFQPVFLVILGLSVAAYSAAFALGVVRIIGPSREVSATQVDAYANMTDSILNTETVKYFNAERHINDRYDAALAKSERQWSTFYARKSINGLLVAGVFALSLGSAIVIGAQQVQQGAMTIGDFVLVNAYMLQIVRPLEALGAAFRDIAYGVAFIEKMMGLMGRRQEKSTGIPIARGSNGHRHAGPDGLEISQLVFSYIPGQQILNNINFAIEPGKTVAIVGSSGAGKSSLIRLLMRFFSPDSGDIYLDGQSIQDMALADLRQAIAIVPQDTVLFNDTIAYNIGFGREGSSSAEIEEAARLAHIHERIMAMPDGYQTIVGERGLKLSGGEKQRVSIARAVLKKPRMFVFDEATSSLDTKTEQTILANMIEVSKAMTTLIIAHRLSTVVHADKIIVLERGAIIEKGSHDILLEKNGAYAAMWRAQHRQEVDGLIKRKQPA